MSDKLISQYDEAIPSATDFVLVDDGSGFYTKSQVANLPGGGGGATTLSAPSLSVSGIDADTIRATIGAVANETSIELQRSNDGSTGWTTIGGSLPANTTTYDDNGLPSATTRHYRVRAVGDGVTYLTSGWSAVANASTSSGDVTAPTVSSAIVQNADSDTIVVVFSESVTGVSASGWSFKKNGSAWAISTVTGSGTTWNFNMASAAVLGDTLLRSYDSGAGATVDGASNELVSFTDSAVTNNVGAPTYLTWGTLSATNEVYNASKGLRKTAGSGNSWGSGTNVSVSNQTIGVGERVIWKITDVSTDAVMVALAAGTTPVDIYGTSGAPFGVVAQPFVIAYGRENGANAPGTPSESLSNGNFLCIWYENSSTVKYQKSTDGISWTTWYTSTLTPSGSYYVHIQPYQELEGAEEIYKA